MASWQIKQDERDRNEVRISRKRLEMHWPAMAVCLFLAFLLWLYVANGGLWQGVRKPPVAESGTGESETAEGEISTLLQE